MRLTLRTLLAYLDHTLDPVDETNLREKVQTSTIASSLVSRIRAVLLTRDVSAPAADAAAPNDDANTVAEYLDSTLAPELTADIERRCLESEAHLAEVAASHQVLAEALAEPAIVPPALRRRVYDLRPAGMAGDGNENEATEPREITGMVLPVGPEDSGVSDATTRLSEELDLSETLAVAAKSIRRNRRTETRLADAIAAVPSPDESAGGKAVSTMAGNKSRQKLEAIEPFLAGGRPSRVVPYLVSLGLAAAFLFVLSQAFQPFLKRNQNGLVLNDDEPVSQESQASDETIDLIPGSENVTPAVPPNLNPPPASRTDPNSQAGSASPAEPVQANVDGPALGQAGRSGRSASGSTVTEIEVSSQFDDVNSQSGEVDAAVSQGPPSLDSPASLLDSVSESNGDDLDDLNGETAVIGGVQSHGGMLLTQAYDQQSQSYQWSKIAPDAKIFSGQTIVCPPTFRSRLVFDGGVELSLIGPAGVRVERKPELDNRLGLTVDYGRLTIMTTSGRSTIWVANPVVTGWIELGGAGAMVAMEINHRRLPGQTIEHSSWKTDLLIDAVAGKVGLRLMDDEDPGNHAVLKLPAGQQLQQTFGRPAEVRNVNTPPPWIDATVAGASPAATAARRGLVELAERDEPIELLLIRAVGYRDLKVASLAARTLASMGVSYIFFGTSDEIGPPGLLNQPEHKANWPELVVSLRSLFERGESSAEGIAYVTTLREGEEDAAKLITMLQGFTPNELEEGGAAFLVAWLDDPKLAVRVMAIETLRQITGETLEYRAEAETPNQRRAAVNRWKVAVKSDRVKYTQ